MPVVFFAHTFQNHQVLRIGMIGFCKMLHLESNLLANKCGKCQLSGSFLVKVRLQSHYWFCGLHFCSFSPQKNFFSLQQLFSWLVFQHFISRNSNVVLCIRKKVLLYWEVFRILDFLRTFSIHFPLAIHSRNVPQPSKMVPRWFWMN